MWNEIKQIFKFPDLRGKIFYTLGILVIFRLAAHLPIPGVNLGALKAFFSQNQLFGLFDIFSGGAMSQFSIVMLGIAPYISASIIFQLLTMVIPSLEALSKEGEAGQQKINRYTRYLTPLLAVLESFGMITLLSRSQLGILPQVTLSQKIIMVLVMTAGAIFLMWLGELISEGGIGNGISLILTFGIIARGPFVIRSIFFWVDSAAKFLTILGFAVLGFLVIFGIVMVDRGMRQIPIVYAKRVRGMRMYGGVSSYLPLKVNQAGVMPIIFAMSFMLFPGVAANFLSHSKITWLASGANFLASVFKPEAIIYGLLYFLLVIGFTYFYSAVTFNPSNISENIQKQGGFIPGLRPGPPTSEYLQHLSNRINLAGGLFLGIIAVLPFVTQRLYPTLALTLGGTAILIVVSVILETSQQIRAQILMRSYETY